MYRISSPKYLVLASLAVASLGTSTGLAEAKTKIGIYFGVSFYDSAIQDDYIYQPGCGWYDPSYGPTFRRNYNPYRVSCNSAARQLRNDGYRRVVALECDGRSYTFRARKGSRSVTLTFNACTGDYYRI